MYQHLFAQNSFFSIPPVTFAPTFSLLLYVVYYAYPFSGFFSKALCRMYTSCSGNIRTSERRVQSRLGPEIGGEVLRWGKYFFRMGRRRTTRSRTWCDLPRRITFLKRHGEKNGAAYASPWAKC